MFTVTSRALLAWMSFTLVSFSSSPALAELPRHLHLQQLGPLNEELIPEGSGYYEASWFGADVVIRNGLAFVGMPLSLTTGRVAVFTQGTTGWVRTATITASDMTSDDAFGRVVSFRDGLLVVGSVRAAYVFKRVNGVWREQQKIVPPATEGVAFFPTDLKHEAGVLAIGAQGNETTRDSVYVFQQDATGKFVRRARIRASDGRLRDRFGSSISMTSSIIVVGAPFGGAAYILGRNSSGTWVQRQRLVPVDTQAYGFGAAVAVDRGMILVGAPGYPVPGGDPNSPPVSGAVYGFVPGGTQYVESFKLHQSDSWDFGTSIAMFGKYIAVSGTYFSYDGEYLGGAIVATYSREGSSVLPLGYAYGSSGPTSVSIANNLLLVGAPFSFCAPYQEFCTGEAHLSDLNRF